MACTSWKNLCVLLIYDFLHDGHGLGQRMMEVGIVLASIPGSPGTCGGDGVSRVRMRKVGKPYYSVCASSVSKTSSVVM